MKRVFDLLIAVAGLLFLLPLILLISAIVRARLGSPIFFRQVRPGKNCKTFVLLKFRTMTDERDESGNLVDDDRRLTRLGSFLRSSSLDELPTLYNVLRGDMSLVGPRPLLVEYLEHYTTEQMRRHEVRPGITGWAQVNGRNAITWEQKFALDVWYVDNQSLLLDLKILVRTFVKVVRRDGISHPGAATMPRFSGSGTGKEGPS